MKKTYITRAGERNIITISSSASLDNFEETLTAETGGGCLGPGDAEYMAEERETIRAGWNQLEEMPEAEARERVEHLAKEWGLEPEELEYLI